MTDPVKALHGTLLPAAGGKGLGLALMVEVLAGIISGAGGAHEVGSMYRDLGAPGRNGQFFLVLDVRRWMPLEVYFERLEALVRAVQGSGDDARLPGELRWRSFDENGRQGIPLDTATGGAIEELADEHGVAVPWTRSF